MMEPSPSTGDPVGSHTAEGIARRNVIRGPKDFWGGLAMLCIAGVSWFMLSDLDGMRGPQFGVGTAPRLFTLFLAITSLSVVVRGLLVEGAPLEPISLRSPVMIIGSVIAFSIAIRPLGLVFACVAVSIMATFAQPNRRYFESAVFVIVLVSFCIAVFKFGLGMPLSLWPRS